MSTVAQAAMIRERALPQVMAALHTRIEPPLAGRDASFEDRRAWLADELARQLEELQAATPGRAWLHVICSTFLSPMLTGWSEHAQALADRIEARCAVRPLAMLQPYQCAAWGFALRFAGGLAGVRQVALSIVDADLHDAMTAGYEREIGRVGFGVTTMGIGLPEQALLPRCGGPYANRAFTEFLHAVKAAHRERGRTPTFIPFLPEGFAGVAERMLGSEGLWPNRHALYGHTFGADPWIGLIEWLQAEPPRTAHTVTLGAFAYHGYYTLCHFDVTPSTRVALKAFDGPAWPVAHEGTLQ